MKHGTSKNKELEIRLREVMYSLYLLRQSLLTKVGIAISGTVMVLALLAPVVAPYSPTTPNFAVKLQPPTFAHVLGTDQFGFDIFSRVLFAYRLDLEIAFAVVILGVTFGVLLGAFAGYMGGKTDEALMRVTDIFFAVPSLILALAVFLGSPSAQSPQDKAAPPAEPRYLGGEAESMVQAAQEV